MFGLKRDPTTAFWRWLVKHRRDIHSEIKGPTLPADQRWSIRELGKQLKAVDADLVHEISMADPATIELIISADGIKATFPAVIALVNSAPKLEGFKITAFRPRSVGAFELRAAGHTITDAALSYRLHPDDHKLGLELFVDADMDQQTRSFVGFLSLDQRLGEYDVATGLGWIEFHPGRPSDAAPITELAGDFDRRRGHVTH